MFNFLSFLMSLLHSIPFKHAIHFLACITLDLISLWYLHVQNAVKFGELTPLSCIAFMTICCSVHKSALTYKEIIFNTFSNQ